MEGVKERLMAEVHEYLLQDSFLPNLVARMESAWGIERDNIVYAMATMISVYLVIGHGAELLCNLIGLAYPAYASFQALETEDKTDDTQWLTYWTIFATISCIDFASTKIVGVFPVYWLAKCVFLLWLYLPIFRGAEFLHTVYFGPLFHRLHQIIHGPPPHLPHPMEPEPNHHQPPGPPAHGALIDDNQADAFLYNPPPGHFYPPPEV